jgi:hypothetical protein
MLGKIGIWKHHSSLGAPTQTAFKWAKITPKPPARRDRCDDSPGPRWSSHPQGATADTIIQLASPQTGFPSLSRQSVEARHNQTPTRRRRTRQIVLKKSVAVRVLGLCQCGAAKLMPTPRDQVTGIGPGIGISFVSFRRF